MGNATNTQPVSWVTKTSILFWFLLGSGADTDVDLLWKRRVGCFRCEVVREGLSSLPKVPQIGHLAVPFMPHREESEAGRELGACRFFVSLLSVKEREHYATQVMQGLGSVLTQPPLWPVLGFLDAQNLLYCFSVPPPLSDLLVLFHPRFLPTATSILLGSHLASCCGPLFALFNR